MFCFSNVGNLLRYANYSPCVGADRVDEFAANPSRLHKFVATKHGKAEIANVGVDQTIQIKVECKFYELE